MAADDFLNQPPDQGLPADLDNGSSFGGNRPASGARRATPGEVLSQGFQGAQNAGDFLGLDTEFTASQDPNQAFAAGMPLDGAPLDLVTPPSAYADDPSQMGAAPVAAPAPMPASDPVQDFAQSPSAFEFGEDLGSEEGELALEQADGPSRKPLFVGALLVAGLVAGAVFYGPPLYTRFLGEETRVAQEEKAPGWQEKPTQPKPVTPAPELPATDPKAASSAAPLAPVADSKPSRGEPAGTDPGSPLRPTAAPEIEPSAAPSPALQASRSEEKSEPAPGAALAALSVPSATPRPTGFPDLMGSDYEWASEDQLELIWRGTEVPLEAVRAPAKTLMPRVGSVRVFTTAGDVFEGRLYAVGQNLVWLDGNNGRIGLDGERIERIQVLPPQAEGQVLASEELLNAGGRRVRVRVPGGMLYGRVLKAEGEDVTLALEDGGRVRVKSADVQDLGAGRTVVVRR